MVIRVPILTRGTRQQRGSLTAELVIAMAILVAAIFPISVGVLTEKRMLTESYLEAVAMEVVDGEAEILAAGGWREIPLGERAWVPQTRAASNLPPGRYIVSRTASEMVVAWHPEPPSRLHVHERRIALP